MNALWFLVMTAAMVSAGMLVRQTYDFRDRLTKEPLHPYLRMMPIVGGVLLFIGFNGGTAFSLMTGLILCILSEIVLLKRR